MSRAWGGAGSRIWLFRERRGGAGALEPSSGVLAFGSTAEAPPHIMPRG